MSERPLIGFRSSSNQPYAYATLSQPDASALVAFIETDVRPDVIACGTAPVPTFALADYIRSAPNGTTRAWRTHLAVEWIRRHGVPASTWATWTEDHAPTESDYLEPDR